MAKQPNNSYISQGINFGVDKRIPLGVVNQVIDRKTGLLLGYMRGDKFYELGTDAAEVDAARVEEKERVETAQKKADAIQEQEDPFLKPFTAMKLGVTVDPETGKTIVASGAEQGGGEVFIYVGPPRSQSGPRGSYMKTQGMEKDTPISVLNDFDAIRKQIINDAIATRGGLDTLFEKLYKNGAIDEETYKSKNISSDVFNKGLLYTVRKFSIETVDKYTINGDKKPVEFGDYLVTGFRPDKPTSRTTYEAIVTRRQDAAEDADQFFMANLGRNATKAEESAYYELLRDAEKKAIQSTTARYDADGNQVSRTQTGELMSDLDKTLLLGKVAGRAIQGSDIDTLLKAGGKATKDVNSILSYAKNYGVVLSREQAMNYVANNFKKGQNVDASRSKILQIAKAQPQYAAIADKISDDVSIKDLAGNYIFQKAQTLELSMDAIDVFDKDIQDGLTGNLSMTEFNKRLRQNPAWANTKNAKEEAANYATDILKSFGLMA